MESSDTGRVSVARWFGPALVLSLVCNISALVFPFMYLKTVLLPTEVYTMFAGVHMLWEGGLYALAVLVVAFSVVFPFAKLGTIAWAWRCGHQRPERARHLLGLVERLAKWSMLDIFLVALMIALTSRQWLIRAQPAIGIVLFLMAVVLSMLCGAHLAARHGVHSTPRRAPVSGLASLMCVAVLLFLPVLRVDSFWLRESPLSFAQTLTGLAGAGAWSLSLAVLVFLIGAPVLEGAGQCLAWSARWKGREAKHWERLSAAASPWAMLDVFTLALMIFLIEGRHMVPTAVQPGCWVLVATMALRVGLLVARR